VATGQSYYHYSDHLGLASMATDALGTMNAQNPFAGWSYHAAGNLTAEPQKT
jgi:hypothetical protein